MKTKLCAGLGITLAVLTIWVAIPMWLPIVCLGAGMILDC